MQQGTEKQPYNTSWRRWDAGHLSDPDHQIRKTQLSPEILSLQDTHEMEVYKNTNVAGHFLTEISSVGWLGLQNKTHQTSWWQPRRNPPVTYTQQELPCPLRPFFSMEKAWVCTLSSIAATTEKRMIHLMNNQLSQSWRKPLKKISFRCWQSLTRQ